MNFQNFNRVSKTFLQLLASASKPACNSVVAGRSVGFQAPVVLNCVVASYSTSPHFLLPCRNSAWRSQQAALFSNFNAFLPLEHSATLRGTFAQVRHYRIHQRKLIANKNLQEKSGDILNPSSNQARTAAESTTKSAEAPKSFWQKIQQKAKQYGKTFLVIHFGTYAIWLGSFYYLSANGVDVRWILDKFHTSEETKKRIENSRFSHAAIAFLLAKIFMPVRYVVSFGLTELAVRALRSRGYLPAVTNDDKLRNLVRKEMGTRVAHIRQVRAARKLQRQVATGHGHAHGAGHTHVQPVVGSTSRMRRTFRNIINKLKSGRFTRMLRRLPK